MAFLPENSEWVSGIYQIEKKDPVHGGPGGVTNKPLTDLAKRTVWLKDKFENAFNGLGWMQLGEWEIGLEVSARDQIVFYNGSWYGYSGELPHTITKESPDEDDKKNWKNIGDLELRSDLKKPTGSVIVGGVLPIWRVGDHGGSYSADEDISEAFNLTAQAKGDRPGDIILPSINGIIYVNADSLRMPKNTILDLQGNTLKLADGASKYVIRNQDESSFGGWIKVTNGIIDGNRPGGQKRRFDKKSVNEDGFAFYDYRDNYPGFALMFSYVEKLTVTDLHVKNAEGWSIAHFKCGDALFDNVSFDATSEVGKNADGITGVGTRRTEIRHIRGYTNDDMCAISTSRATVGTYAIFNPKEGASIEAFTVDGLLPIKKGTLNPHVAVGIYVSDNFEIDLVTLRDIRGYFYNYVARMGNYWNNTTWNAPNGKIRRVLIDNVSATSYMIGCPDFYMFQVENYQLDVRGVFANKSKNLIGSKNRSPLIQIGPGAYISYLNTDNCYYFNDSEPLEGQRHSMVEVHQEGLLKDLTLNVSMDFSFANVDKNTVFLKHDNSNTTLSVVRAILGTPSLPVKDFAATQVQENNLFINDGAGTIRVGGTFNFKIRKELELLSGVTPASDKLVLLRDGNRVYLTGRVTIPDGFTQGTVFAKIPQWAIPYDAEVFIPAMINDSLCRVRVNAAGLSVYPGPVLVGHGLLFCDGVTWEPGVRLNYPQ